MRRQKTLKMIEKECYGKILDLGCGTGSVTNYLYNKGFDVGGCDFHKGRLDIAKENNPNINYFLFNLDKENLKRKYDVIILMGVLEGINSLPWDVLKKLRNNLRENGKIIFEVPNINSLSRIIRSVFGRDPPDPMIPKAYIFTKKRIIEMIKKTDYKIVKLTTTKFISIRNLDIPMINSLSQEFFVIIK